MAKIESPPITRVFLYVKNVSEVAAFYQRYFGMSPLSAVTEGWLELGSTAGGCTIALHKAAAPQKSGASMKIVFGVRDGRLFRAECEAEGFEFGPKRAAGGFEFANAKDPAGNSIGISRRGLT